MYLFSTEVVWVVPRSLAFMANGLYTKAVSILSLLIENNLGARNARSK